MNVKYTQLTKKNSQDDERIYSIRRMLEKFTNNQNMKRLYFFPVLK